MGNRCADASTRLRRILNAQCCSLKTGSRRRLAQQRNGASARSPGPCGDGRQEHPLPAGAVSQHRDPAASRLGEGRHVSGLGAGTRTHGRRRRSPCERREQRRVRTLRLRRPCVYRVRCGPLIAPNHDAAPVATSSASTRIRGGQEELSTISVGILVRQGSLAATGAACHRAPDCPATNAVQSRSGDSRRLPDRRSTQRTDGTNTAESIRPPW
jgi:hypothetical protein